MAGVSYACDASLQWHSVRAVLDTLFKGGGGVATLSLAKNMKLLRR